MDIVDDLRVHFDYLSWTVLLQTRHRYARQVDIANKVQTSNQFRESAVPADAEHRPPFDRS